MSTIVPSSGSGGMSTESITWIVPFAASMSVISTRASFSSTVSPSTVMFTASPCTVVTESSVTTSAAIAFPATTWYSRTSVSAGMSPQRLDRSRRQRRERVVRGREHRERPLALQRLH